MALKVAHSFFSCFSLYLSVIWSWSLVSRNSCDIVNRSIHFAVQQTSRILSVCGCVTWTLLLIQFRVRGVIVSRLIFTECNTDFVQHRWWVCNNYSSSFFSFFLCYSSMLTVIQSWSSISLEAHATSLIEPNRTDPFYSQIDDDELPSTSRYLLDSLEFFVRSSRSACVSEQRVEEIIPGK